MSEENELDYQLYLIKSVLADCIDKLGMSKNRAAFLLYYDISAEDSHEIDKLFAEISFKDEVISFADFQKELNERLSLPLAEKSLKKCFKHTRNTFLLRLAKLSFKQSG